MNRFEKSAVCDCNKYRQSPWMWDTSDRRTHQRRFRFYWR